MYRTIAMFVVIVTAVPAHASQHHRYHRLHHPGYAAQGQYHARGAIYNGQDYLGTDPDPNIRSYIRRDLDSRYGGR